MFGGSHDDASSAPQDNSVPAAQDDGLAGGPVADNPLPDTSAPTASYSPTALDEPAAASPAPATPTDDTDVVAPEAHQPMGGSDDLLQIKQQALQQLSPLVGHLDQTPEEKFRTTMMMIQASDNQELIKEAYAAAQNITDEKTRAQALLDIVNEINYFTSSHQS